MKKELLPPLLVLALLLAFSLWNGAAVSAHTVRWTHQLERCAAEAEAQRWESAETALAQSYEDWQSQQVYLHIVLEHDAVDDAGAMYRRAMAFARQREPSEFQAELADLMDQLRLLAEMEQFSIKNVL